MPPLNLARGQVLLDPARRLDEIDRVIVVLLQAGGDGQDVRVEDDVLRRKAGLFGQNLVGARADLLARSSESAWPCSSKAMTTTAAP